MNAIQCENITRKMLIEANHLCIHYTIIGKSGNRIIRRIYS